MGTLGIEFLLKDCSNKIKYSGFPTGENLQKQIAVIESGGTYTLEVKVEKIHSKIKVVL